MVPESTWQVLRASTFRVEPGPWVWARAGRVDRADRHLVVVREVDAVERAREVLRRVGVQEAPAQGSGS